ncbi:MAG: TrmH family RNA methyltransferase [Prevotella sp.]|nr:TrmH family RNA methyltransferase [Prevotella sp.]MDD7272441.1 TrmH family RNA methyltransferase [Prevotellaceae bacterium]MDY3935199.1 TrmH family RNA methyltransferase [Prevotella sp.]MDY4218755.1 TrmH family RNA methyltransferase [Prevotella sp.]
MRKLRTIEMKRLSLEEFKEAKKLPLIVVLDNVRSLHNVGSVFRTCDAFKVEAVFLCGITATPPNAEIHKTALGGEDAVEWQYFAETEDAIKELHKRGFFVYSIEQVAGSTMLQNLHTSLKNDAKKYAHPSTSPAYAVVFGNEVKGVKQSVIDLSDDCLEIPQFGTKHSLNVSVTAGIVIWEFARHLLLG